MTAAKILFLTLVLLVLSTRAFAEGSMSIRLGATAQFVYVWIVDVVDKRITLRRDVTTLIPHEVQKIDNQEYLVIDWRITSNTGGNWKARN